MQTGFVHSHARLMVSVWKWVWFLKRSARRVVTPRYVSGIVTEIRLRNERLIIDRALECKTH